MPESSVYTELPTHRSIRLLRLTSDLGNGDLHCSLEVIDDYSNAPRYHCLSYCWGDTSAFNLTDIKCNGKTISVTKNLHAALTQIRRNGQTQYLWADAISINQADITERNQQVAIMSEIFGHSDRVYVWHGPGTYDSSDAVAAIEKLSTLLYEGFNPTTSMTEWLDALSIDPLKREVIRKQTALRNTDLTPEAWRAFRHFMLAPWFDRVWVIQEVRQQKDVWILCGEYAVKWDRVCLAAFWSTQVDLDFWGTEWDATLMPFRKSCINVTFMWDVAQNANSFLDVLNSSRFFRATDARDKVFAMLHHGARHDVGTEHKNHQIVQFRGRSASLHETHHGMQADYHMSTFDVYREVAVQSFLVGRNADVLAYAWPTAHFDAIWPSWVPRWDIPCENRVQPLVPSLYSADGATALDWAVGDRAEVLLIRGLCIGTITDVSACVNAWSSNEDARNDGQQAFVEDIQDAWELISMNQSKLSFTSFALYLLEGLEHCDGKTWVPLLTIACDRCRKTYGSINVEARLSPLTFYHCRRCNGDNFDICTTCFEEHGLRCHDSTHILVKHDIPGILLTRSDDCIETLKSYAKNGSPNFARTDLSHGNGYAGFFKTDTGLRGTGSGYATEGDIVVVFFGTGIPFVLRPHENGFRLVSGCYVLGHMDGEAIQRWEAGELQAQQFAIK